MLAAGTLPDIKHVNAVFAVLAAVNAQCWESAKPATAVEPITATETMDADWLSLQRVSVQVLQATIAPSNRFATSHSDNIQMRQCVKRTDVMRNN